MRTQLVFADEMAPEWDAASGQPPLVAAWLLNWNEDGELYTARVPVERLGNESFGLDTVEGLLVPREHFQLKYDPAWNWMIASGPLRIDQHLKGAPFVLHSEVFDGEGPSFAKSVSRRMCPHEDMLVLTSFVGRSAVVKSRSSRN